jgi:acyl-CoA synthetase (AMP-forming)/AMP-acid ligase II
MRAVLEGLEHSAVAVRSHAGSVSGPEMLGQMGGAARWLRGLGADSGPAVPALVGWSAESMALAVGGGMSGRPLAPLGARLSCAELVAMVAGLGCEVLVCDQGNAALATDVAEGAGVRLAVFEEFADAELPDGPSDQESTIVLLHTSGTTGRPKPVPVPDRAKFHRAIVYQRELGLAPGELYCSAGGFHHTGGVGMCMVALASGAGVVMLPRFTAATWRSLAELRPSCALLVPTMIDLLLEQGALGAVPLRALHYGTAPIHPATLRAALDALPSTTFAQAFGQSEGGPLAVLSHADHMRALAGDLYLLSSVGKPPAGCELRLDDCDENGVGEVVARAEQVFQPGPDGWLHTGDLGRIDDEGYLYLQGRLGDKIIRGGENVYPLEVERVLETHPGVREAAVVGVEDRRWGETIKAFVAAVDPSRPPAVADLVTHAKAELASFKVPTDWAFVDELPRNVAGKLLRRALPR